MSSEIHPLRMQACAVPFYTKKEKKKNLANSPAFHLLTISNLPDSQKALDRTMQALGENSLARQNPDQTCHHTGDAWWVQRRPCGQSKAG